MDDVKHWERKEANEPGAKAFHDYGIIRNSSVEDYQRRVRVTSS